MWRSKLNLWMIALLLIGGGCDETPSNKPQQATVSVQAGADGLTVEQRNVRERLIQDNKPGAIQHLYVISAYSGQVLLYSTVRGKVTSSGKRLDRPEEYQGASFSYSRMGDDGTWGQSVPYIYWWDSRGIYHQHYVEGGQIVHVSSEPIAVKGVVINLETR
jgi:hypothetical protein